MARIVSVNGLDGSGKSTQVELLGSMEGVQPIRKDGSGFPDFSPYGASEWWFHPDNHPKLADALGRLIISAEEQASTEATVYVADRGPTMHLAALTATVMTTDGSEFDEAMVRSATLLENVVGFDVTDSRWDELLLTGNHRSNDETTAGHTPNQNYRYDDYQTNLRYATNRLFDMREDAHVIPDGPIIDVQNTIRREIASKYRIDPTFCDNLDLIVGFGGMTESGKSSHAEHLRVEEDFMRLKIRSIDQLFHLEHGRRPTSDELTLRTAIFVHANAFARSFSVESIHRPEVHDSMRRYFGDRYQLVYMDADSDARMQRTADELGITIAEAEEKFQAKEATKAGRGADTLKARANLVVDTGSAPIEDTTAELSEFVRHFSTE